MAWKYEQSTGKFYHNDTYVATGYAGHPPAVNDPKYEKVKSVGPIPRGQWSIEPIYDSKTLGVRVMNLLPVGHNAHGRNLFRIHGDNRKLNRTASHGCIILPRAIRELVGASEDRELHVV